MSSEQKEPKQLKQKAAKKTNSVSIKSLTSINLSLGELNEPFSEVVSEEICESIRSTSENKESVNWFSKFKECAKFAFIFPFVSDKKLLESSSEEDPFSLLATLILKFICLALFLTSALVFLNGILVCYNIHSDFILLQYSAPILFIFAFLLYTVSLLCRMAAARLDKAQDPSLALSFLALFVSVISLLIPILPFIKTFSKGG